MINLSKMPPEEKRRRQERAYDNRTEVARVAQAALTHLVWNEVSNIEWHAGGLSCHYQIRGGMDRKSDLPLFEVFHVTEEGESQIGTATNLPRAKEHAQEHHVNGVTS